MEAFATVAQYKAKYSTEMSDTTLAVWLVDASSMMRAEMDASNIAYENPSQDFADILMGVCRDATHRAIGDDDEADITIPYGATQVNMSGGSYSRGFSFGSDGYGDLFLTRNEKLQLGIGTPKACVLSPYGGD